MRELLAVLLLTAGLAGCQNQPDWSKMQWPRQEKDVAAQPAPAAAPPMADKPATRPAGDVDSRAIKINDRKVTISDILKSADYELRKIGKPATAEAFATAAAPILLRHRGHLVAEALLYGAAERGMNDQARKHLDDEVKEAQDRWLADAGGDRRRLKDNLAKEGMTIEDALTRYRRDVTINLYLREQLIPRVTITRDTLLQYYTDHESDFRRPVQVQMQIVEAPFEAFLASPLANPTEQEARAAKDAARQAVRQAAAALTRGEEFGVVAETYSRGVKRKEKGIWPPMPDGSFRQEAVSKAAFSQPEGAVSGIIETPDGFYIVKTRRIYPGKVEVFEDVQTKIEASIREEQFKRLRNEHIAELAERAAITEPRGFLNTLMDQTVRTYYGPVEPKPLNPEPTRRPQR
ncbi:MAG: peptidyl-prolyl cis-trans isomerase [Planctomycetota bacterium]|nr:peptidyl-prolyl cis-trans isomerase [Planctomycetota bacterium]